MNILRFINGRLSSKEDYEFCIKFLKDHNLPIKEERSFKKNQIVIKLQFDY